MTSNARHSPADGLAAFLAFAPRLLRARWFGVIGLALGLAGTAAGVLTTKRVYRSEAVLIYERGLVYGVDGDAGRQLGIRLQDMVASRSRLEGLIRKNKLFPKLVDSRGMVEAIDEMTKHIAVTLREGFTYRISYDANDRDQAKNILDQLLASILQEDKERRRRQADEANHFFESERVSADQDVKTKEAAVSSFLAKHPQLASEGAAPGGTIRAAERDRGGGADTFSLEMQAATVEQAIAARADAVPQNGKAGPRGRVVDPVLAAAQARAAADLRAAQKDLSDKQSRFTNDHPDVKAAVRNLKEAEAVARQADAAAAAGTTIVGGDTTGAGSPGANEGASQLAGMQRALAAIRAQIAAVHARAVPRDEVARDLKSAVAVDSEWVELVRAASKARERQQQLESRQFQAQLTATLVAANQAGGFVVTDPPYRPMRPVTSGRAKVAGIGAFGSIAFALLLMFIAALFDRRIYGVDDMSHIIPTETLIVVPRLEARQGD